ncbi:MAG: hypothetical protein ACK4K7_03095 [Allosphingosinicella sp.]|uniref:hypothetical protein n=1 Tax=Allosphingosinicella sp. TaxID=2823234 RepID=UPI00392CFAB6
MTAQLVTQAEYARHRGVGRSAVSNWKKDGLLVFAEGPDGRAMVDLARSDMRVNARIDPMRGRPPASAMLPLPDVAPSPVAASSPAAAEGQSLQALRMAESHERTIGHRLKNARDAGELAPIEELASRASEMARATRERVHAWYRSVAERITAERDLRRVLAIGEEGIDRLFEELADAAEMGAFAPDEEELDVAAAEEIEAEVEAEAS